MKLILTLILIVLVQLMEEQVDAEMKKLESMDEDELETLKKNRIGEYFIFMPGKFF